MIEMRTRVFDQQEGQYRFELPEGTRINKKETLDDGMITVSEFQADNMFLYLEVDVVSKRSSKDLTAPDMPQYASASMTLPISIPQKLPTRPRW